MLFTLWLIVIIVVLWIYFKNTYSKLANAGVRHLPVVPLFGNMTRTMLKKEHVVETLMRSIEAFPQDRIVGQYEMLEPVYIINDLELMKRIAIKDFEYFVDRTAFVDETDWFFGRNLLVLTGDEWKAMRSTLSPAFTSSKIHLMIPLMVEVAERMVFSLKKKIEDSEESFRNLDAKDIATRYANDVIASCAFGLKIESHSEDNAFYKRALQMTGFTFKRFLKILVLRFSPRLNRLLKLKFLSKEEADFFLGVILSTMKYRDQHHIVRNDMIDLLMQAKRGQLTHDPIIVKDADAGYATVEESAFGRRKHNIQWTDIELISQAVLFLFAGFDTVSTMMAFTMHELAIHPEIQERLYQEIRNNEQVTNGKIDIDAVKNLKYLDMVTSESMRVWPAVAIANRKCVKDYNAGRAYAGAPKDCIIRKGGYVQFPIWSIHHNPEYFPDPYKFDPERFSDENKHKIKQFTYLPFGLGPRNCIGSRFALCEVKVMLYHVLLNFEITPCDKTRNPATLEKNGFNMHIEGGAWIRLRCRD